MENQFIVNIHWNEENIRTYFVPNFQLPLPSVTTICGIDPVSEKYLNSWRKTLKHPDEIAKYRATAGTLVHFVCANHTAKAWNLPHIPLDIEYGSESSKIIQKYYDKFAFAGRTNKYGSGIRTDVQFGYEIFTTWFDKTKPKPPIHEIGDKKGEILHIHPCEHMVYNKTLRYAGTADLLCNINGENWIVDLKFNEKEMYKYWLQLMAYRLALLEMYPTTLFNNLAILNLRTSDSEPGFNPVPNIKKPLIEKNWKRFIGAYYYKNQSQFKENAECVFNVLKQQNIEIIKELTEHWIESLGQITKT